MSTYVLAYTGGTMAESEEEQKAVMAAWGAWISGLGDALTDAGNPFGPSATVAADGSVSEGNSAGLPATRSSPPTAWTPAPPR